MRFYLEFEKTLKILDEKISFKESLTDPPSNISKEIAELHEKRLNEINRIHSKLNRWQRVQLARHPQRPYSLDYISEIIDEFFEIHGDRLFGDDHAVITGFGKIESISVAIIAQQKGRDTKENLYRNFGMMNPEGYRKALRVMKIAEKFKIPVVTFMDTPGAYPGIGAEERGQGEAIAKNLLEMSSLKVPVVSVVIGEGASGGALGIGICDKFLMMQNSWYSVISPEGCASILFRDAGKAEAAAEALKVTPNDMMDMGICDEIITEPNGGAHRYMLSAANNLKKTIINSLNGLMKIDNEKFIDLRIDKYDKLGSFHKT